jgi:hypothetical protein
MITQKPFLIIGLPRSRTAWLANYFTNNGVICYHDLLTDIPVGGLFKAISPKHGNADSALCLYPDYVLEMEESKNVRILVIDRNVNDCMESLKNALWREGFDNPDEVSDKVFGAAFHGYEMIKRFTKGMVVNYNHIDEKLSEIHNYLTPGASQYSGSRHKMLLSLNVTQNIKKKLTYATIQLNSDQEIRLSEQTNGGTGIK